MLGAAPMLQTSVTRPSPRTTGNPPPLAKPVVYREVQAPELVAKAGVGVTQAQVCSATAQVVLVQLCKVGLAAAQMVKIKVALVALAVEAVVIPAVAGMMHQDLRNSWEEGEAFAHTGLQTALRVTTRREMATC